VLDIIARKLFCGEKKNGEWLQVTECSARRRKEGGCGWVSLTDSQKKSFFLFFFFLFSVFNPFRSSSPYCRSSTHNSTDKMFLTFKIFYNKMKF
jgi:hypothetical protein